MTHASAFLPMILPHVQECPTFVAERHVRDAAIEWCRRTRMWRHEIDQAVTENPITLTLPEHSTMFEIERLALGGHELTPVARPDLPIDASGEAGNPRWLTQTAPGTIEVYPVAEAQLSGFVYLTPSKGMVFSGIQNAADVVPDWLFDVHGDAIAAGAVSRIMFLPRQPYSDPSMGAYHKARFDQAAREHADATIRGQQRAPKRTTPGWY